MEKSFLLTTFILILIEVKSKEKNAEYYKKVWYESYIKSFYWERPEFNEDFKIVDSPCTEEPIEYDFVIVGAGSAGAVMASRLSEIDDWKILLIEAGEDETDFSLMPGAFFPVHNSKKNWGYLTTPQNNACLNMKNHQCDAARGKGLGGTSSINGMFHIRGNKADYDDWGLPGWGFKDLLKYFKKSEGVNGIKNINRKYRGTEGPLSVSYPNASSELTNIVFAAYKEIGYEEVDYNQEQLGYARLQGTLNNGKRWSTNQAYLKPARKNLKILTNALATKIFFDKAKQATGLKFIHKNRCKIVRFKEELILSAGVINTPQLLLLSGVGPKEDPSKLEIPLVSDLPVGLNVEDHVAITILPTTSAFKSKYSNEDEIFKDYANNRGQMTDLSISQVVFTATNESLRAQKRPEFEVLYFTPPSHISSQVFVPFYNLKEMFRFQVKLARPSMINLQLILLHPKSKGKITLKSKNPLDFPLIDLNLLSHPDDVESLYQGFTDLLKIVKTKSFSKIGLKFLLVPPPQCWKLKGKAQVICFIKNNSASVYHTIGSCRMGVSPKDSVVGLDLKLHGFEKIRVVDSSVIPSSTGAHTNSVTIAFAEKISDTIKSERNLNK